MKGDGNAAIVKGCGCSANAMLMLPLLPSFRRTKAAGSSLKRFKHRDDAKLDKRINTRTMSSLTHEASLWALGDTLTGVTGNLCTNYHNVFMHRGFCFVLVQSA